MSGANLQRARFAGHSLNGLDLSGADCTGADFSGCDFTGIKPATPPPVLTGANLMGAVLPAGISWPDVKMAGAVLAQAKLSGDFSGPTADLTGVNFNGQGASYFTPVYQGGGFGGFDLTNPANQVIAYDYTSSGKLDHLVCYRPGPRLGQVWIVRNNADGTFTQVYGRRASAATTWPIPPTGSSPTTMTRAGPAAGLPGLLPARQRCDFHREEAERHR